MVFTRFSQLAQLLFTFNGRINRKTFWSVASIWLLALTTIILIGIFHNVRFAYNIFLLASILWILP